MLGTDGDDLDARVTGMLLRALQALTPEERTAFILHEVLRVDAAVSATRSGRDEDSVRQLAASARDRIATTVADAT